MTPEHLTVLLAQYVEAAIEAHITYATADHAKAKEACADVLAEFERVTALAAKWEKAYGEAGAELITRRGDHQIFKAQLTERQKDYRRTLHDVMECAAEVIAERDKELAEVRAAVVELAPAPNSQDWEKVGASWELPSQAVVSEAVAHSTGGQDLWPAMGVGPPWRADRTHSNRLGLHGDGARLLAHTGAEVMTASGAIDAAVEAATAVIPVDPDDGTCIVAYQPDGIPLWGTPQSLANVIVHAAAPVLLADMRAAYDLKVQELARETERVSVLAARLTARGCGPDGHHAKPGYRNSCDDCIALAKALGVAGKPDTQGGHDG